ncbi:MAG: putative ABC transporter ATP-binding protein [Flavobacteriaceae bacterium]|jgi:ABC-type multidrug transport system fused ATPase/permease subunit|nr:MAG: putative ABC transporter ATP-binding protein [Flavobacteriaceae bacterium]
MSKKEASAKKSFDIKLFSRVFSYTTPYRGIFIVSVLSAILISAFSVLTPSLVGRLIDEAITQQNAELLLQLIIAMAAVLFGEVFFQLLFTYTANLLGESIIKDLRTHLFSRMIRFRMTYFDKSSVGILVTRAVSDMQKIGEIFSQGFFMIIADVLKMLVVATVMLVMNWKLALLVFSIMPLILYATRWFQKSMKVAFVEVRAQIAALNSFVQERLAGIRVLQLFHREDEEAKAFRAINLKHQNAWLKTVWYNSIFFAIAELLASITVGLIVWYGGVQNVGGISPEGYGDIFTFILLSSLLFRPLRHIADKFNVLQMGMVAAGRVFDILDDTEQLEDEGDAELDEVQGKVAFKDVVFAYDPEKPVLRGVNFNIEPGQCIAVVGATGAGKSTLINLLNRFYEIENGAIEIDDLDIRRMTLRGLRSHISVVLQDVFLFADTIEKNITLGNPNITLDTVIEAAKAIGVHEFIKALPGGYHFEINERGSTLSSGQRQLISFLRAYVANPSILVLDEATSSIDTYAEQLIQRATEKITEGRTSIIIAHRLATVQKADVILVMDQGQVVERGSHEELLSKKGMYYQLYQAQFAVLSEV